MASTYHRIYQVVRKIPRGRVATYGQIARLAGLGRAARQVGYALSSLSPGEPVPWHRVINAKGEISLRRTESGCEDRQRTRLEAEGVELDAQGRIDLSRFQWRPRRKSF
jgi:methylated-DNA-protein-cysteine methyltransferase-like protein